jgi:superfamily I DNA/RNA helicase
MPLPQPVGAQREVVALDPVGHYVVLGTAGSGKTTMAIHRAAFLANQIAEHSGTTLLVTFNKALVTYLNYLKPPELGDVEVRNYHHFARGYLKDRGLMSYSAVATPDQRERLISEAVDTVRAAEAGQALLRRPLDFFLEEIRWIIQHGFDDRDAYVEADRVGRAEARLQKRQRPLMFRVYEEYLRLRGKAGKRYDWDDIATATLRAFEDDGGDRYYRHVVIDEGQDFSPQMIRSLAAAIPEDGSLTLFGDVAQQIYGRRLSWADAGLAVAGGGVWRFERNYRNSPQIAALGLAIAAMPYYAGEPDMVAPTEFAADGPKPTLVRFESAPDEIKFVIEQAKAAAESGSVAVLLRTHQDEALFGPAFSGAQRIHRELATWNPGAGISHGTVHSAKGFEFDTVILPRLSVEHWPEPQVVEAHGADEAASADGRLLYVGVTRARQGLILTCTGELTELMPANNDLWQEARPE